MKRFLALLLPLVLVACSPAPHDASPPVASAAAPASTVHAAAHATDTAAALGRYHWQLARATNKAGARVDALFTNPAKPLQLDFAAGRLAISHTCNRMSGRYTLGGGKLTVGPMAQTMMACPDTALMAMDKAVANIFHGGLAITLAADATHPQLTLVDAGGGTLVFDGTPTAATRYGSKGATMFLEVAAADATCPHEESSAATCLRVRERHYDAKGLRLDTPGPWHVLATPIEGYTHKAGVRNVLRVTRFKRTDVPTGAASSAYVLDMVVASQVAPATSSP